MKRLGVILLVATALLQAPVDVAAGCSCPQFDLETLVNRAGAIFVGVLVESVAAPELEADPRAGIAPAIHTFAVSEVLKGEVPERHSLQSPSAVDNCGIAVELGKEYLVYTARDTVDRAFLCDGTAYLDPIVTEENSGQDLITAASTAAPPTEPEQVVEDGTLAQVTSDPPADDFPYAALIGLSVGLAALLAIVLAVWGIRRRRDPYNRY